MAEPAPDDETAAFLREFLALAAAAPPGEPSIGERRAALDSMAKSYGPPPAPVGDIRDIAVPGPGGRVPLRIYRPEGPETGRPIVLHLHGGGWALGGPAAYERVCRAYCAEGGAVVVDVDYRRAPEHKFPAAIEDCEAALDWVVLNAASLGGDARRLVVAGDSAGGALAASLCLRTRHAVALQVLVYPVLSAQVRADFASRRELGDGRFFLREFDIHRAEREYLADPAQGDDPRVSPLAVDDGALAGQPTTLFVVAGLDPLKDEAELYAERLRGQGVPVEYVVVEGVIHAFVLFAGAFQKGRDALSLISRRIREVAAAD
jgi:acetyl esterase